MHPPKKEGVPFIRNARVAELVDALDSKSCAFGRAGSIPAPGTKPQLTLRLFYLTDCPGPETAMHGLVTGVGFFVKEE